MEPYPDYAAPRIANCNPGACVLSIAADRNAVTVQAKEGAYRSENGNSPFAPVEASDRSGPIHGADERGAVVVASLTAGDVQLVGTFGGGVLLRWGSSAPTEVNAGLDSRLVTGLALLDGASRSAVLASTVGGLFRADLPPTRWERMQPLDTPLLSAVAVHGADILVGTPRGLLRSSDQGQSFALVPELTGFVSALTTTPSGDLWVGTWGHGAYRGAGNPFELEPVDVAREGLRVATLAPSRQGLLVGTGRGDVYRWTQESEVWSRVGAVHPPMAVTQLAEAPDGSVLVGNGEQVARLYEGKAERLTTEPDVLFAPTRKGVVLVRNASETPKLEHLPYSGQPARCTTTHPPGSVLDAGAIAREPGGRIVLLDSIPPLVSTDEGRTFELGGDLIMGSRWTYDGWVVTSPKHTVLVPRGRDQVYLMPTGGRFPAAAIDIPTGPWPCVAPLADGSVVSIQQSKLYRAAAGSDRGTPKESNAPACRALSVLPDGSVVLMVEGGKKLLRTTDFAAYDPVALWPDDDGSPAPPPAGAEEGGHQ